ncbi:hypothetical protein MLD38_030174 [Melastoma candidum]|uniref:Uncharacterized protein n=1 Tax=Melastoma candidum TaxID=119954 RepID=A0ACB9MMX1_9MYRT|nr:hypothetical protein MLD38_030174 [Melastoma candidum]
MLSLRPARRFYRTVSSAAIVSSSANCPAVKSSSPVKKFKPVEEPALVKLKSERDPEKLFELFKEHSHNRLVIENRVAFEDTVCRLKGAGRFDLIEHLLEHQKSLPQGRREGFIVRIIMLYGKVGMVNHAVDTFYNMHVYGCRRTVKSLNATLSVLMQTRDLGAIEALLAEGMSKFGILFDVISVNIVTKGLCEMLLLDKACALASEMEKMGILPDIITYTTLMTAFYKSNRCEVGNGFWNLMVHKGCLPNIVAFNARIQYLVNRRRPWDANRLAALMKKVGISPDEITYNLVIKGFCISGNLEMAKRVYSALHGNGLRPNEKIYQTMIHYLCVNGDYDVAYTMCKDSMKKNWFPSVDTIRTLLEGLQMSGQTGKANMIMILVRKRKPAFLQKQMDAFRCILSKK